MFRVVLLTLAVASFSGCVLRGTPAGPTERKMNAQILEGAYEVVSETTTLTKPQQSTERREAKDWTGIWLFHQGRFSETSMKRIRDWYKFPQNQQALGYESSAGTYQIERNKLTLNHDLSLNPLGIGHVTNLEFKITGDDLMLTETMHPYMEDLSEGQRTIVLKRLKPDQ